MAVQSRSLRVSSTEAAKLRIKSTYNKPVKFAASAGAVEVVLPPGTAMAFNTSTNLWVQWATGGANGTGTVRGIVWPNPVTIKATGGGEVIGSMMIRGEAHYADIVSGGGTGAQLIAALKKDPAGDDDLRNLGIDILGLDSVP